jgi:uncharacterized membrane-anchored protein YhcB (DUF1043 family)
MTETIAMHDAHATIAQTEISQTVDHAKNDLQTTMRQAHDAFQSYAQQQVATFNTQVKALLDEFNTHADRAIAHITKSAESAVADIGKKGEDIRIEAIAQANSAGAKLEDQGTTCRKDLEVVYERLADKLADERRDLDDLRRSLHH